MILPALIRVLEPWLFPETHGCRLTCNFMTCTLASCALCGVVAVNLHQFMGVPWGTLGWGMAVAVLAIVGLCGSVQRWNNAQALS